MTSTTSMSSMATVKQKTFSFVSVFRCISILLFLSFIFTVVTLYWRVTVIHLLNARDSKPYMSPLLKQLSEEPTSKSIISSGGDDKEDEDDLVNTQREIEGRLENVTRFCRQYHLGQFKWKNNNTNDLNLKEPPTPLFSYYFWNREKRLAWCPVYKAGSTSWLQNMMRLKGFSEDVIQHPPKQLSIWARDVYGDLDNFRRDELDKSVRLIVVRHPFERLMSAFRDKLANSTSGQEHGTHHFYLRYGHRIVKKFRKNPKIRQVEPTWEEFVRYIIKTELIQYADDHWLPAYYSCTPCLVDYTIVAKTETYFRDQKYIIKKAGLERMLQPRWSHSSILQQSNNKKERETRLRLRKEYFSQLTKSQITELYEKYKLDFLLFGYDYKEYLMYGKD